MSSNDTINVKWNHEGTFRRFHVPRSSGYAGLLEKVKSVVPDFKGALGYKDEDGDMIIVSSDEEMIHAASLPVNQQLLRIFTIELPHGTQHAEETEKPTTEPSAEKEAHLGVTCDHCNEAIFGIRYKCFVCDDYDLCEKCEKGGFHSEHPMIRYCSPRTPRLDSYCRFRGHHSFHRHRRGGFNGPFMAEGIFNNVHAQAAANAASQAAHAAAHAAAHHAATAAAAFSQRYQQANQETNPQANNTQEGPQQFRESFAQGMEYLKEVGLQVQQALASFGIDVDMDVQHNGVTEKVPKPGETNNEEKKAEEKKPEEKPAEEKQPEEKKDAEKRKNSGTQEETEENDNAEEDVTLPMKKMHISDPAEEPLLTNVPQEKEKEIPPKNVVVQAEHEPETELLVDILGEEETDSEAWTMMGDKRDKQSPTPVEQVPPPPSVYPSLPADNKDCQAGTPFVVPPPGPHNPHCFFIHPDKEVAVCVEQLEAMGFDNCNGWLTKLSAAFDGNIMAVVDSIREDPVYAERLRKA